MEFQFSAEQDALRDSVRAFLDDWRGRADARDGLAPHDWHALVGLGWTGLLVPEEHGGLGLGLVDAVVVLEEMGRVAFPGPYLSAAVIAAVAARRLGLAEELRSIARGEAGTVALEESGAGHPVDRVRSRARRRGADWVLTGEKPLVLDGPGAPWVLVVARTPDGLATFRIDAPMVDPVSTLDLTRRAGRLVLDETVATPVGPSGDHTSMWHAANDDVAVALAAELTGVCDASIAMAMDYAEQRVQFDRPIASHQVIQHKLVDMLHATELGRVGVHYAAWASDTSDSDAARAASIAKAQMGDAGVMVTGENIQIHGAVGFTWESRAGVLYQRAKQNDVLGGTRSWHRARIADLVLDAG
ncbi:MAG: acyl-CoA dehydrogenase family protein [Acidimicrobiia bacterium]